MALRLTQLDETNRPAFEALLAQAWAQNWSPDLARALIGWRYGERVSGGGTWLACHNGQCVAMLDSFLRPYLLDGERILVREGCDWYCLPQYRQLGLGIRLMRAMMTAPEPMIGIGGSEATVSLLPRLHWRPLPEVRRYVLPVSARGLTGIALRSRWPAGEICAKAIPGSIRLRSRRLAPAPRTGRIAEWTPGAPALIPAPQRRGLVQILTQADLDWLARMPAGVARLLGLSFFLEDAPAGFSLAQIEPTAAGPEARIVHLQTRDASQELMDWVVAATAAHLAARGVGVIRCLASSPEKEAALLGAGFRPRQAHPAHWWSSAGMAAPSEIDAGYLRADDAVPFRALTGRRMAMPWRARGAADPAVAPRPASGPRTRVRFG